jgi:acetyl-CoA carboxylase biotin carboxyl carrier protein
MPGSSIGDGGRAGAPAADDGGDDKAAEPGAKAFVSVGDRVSKGQIVCIIEAMKIMNEIESEHSGVVREILVQDAQPVEYGQVLFRIDPNG